MFTLKLYQNGPLPPDGRTVIIECDGIWMDHCEGDIKAVHVFKKKVGVQDEDPLPMYYVGGNVGNQGPGRQDDTNDLIVSGRGGNYYTWGVLENAQGKTTEMIR